MSHQGSPRFILIWWPFHEVPYPDLNQEPLSFVPLPLFKLPGFFGCFTYNMPPADLISYTIYWHINLCILVIYYYVTDHPETQGLKTSIFLISHSFSVLYCWRRCLSRCMQALQQASQVSGPSLSQFYSRTRLPFSIWPLAAKDVIKGSKLSLRILALHSFPGHWTHKPQKGLWSLETSCLKQE